MRKIRSDTLKKELCRFRQKCTNIGSQLHVWPSPAVFVSIRIENVYDDMLSLMRGTFTDTKPCIRNRIAGSMKKWKRPLQTANITLPSRLVRQQHREKLRITTRSFRSRSGNYAGNRNRESCVWLANATIQLTAVKIVWNSFFQISKLLWYLHGPHLGCGYPPARPCNDEQQKIGYRNYCNGYPFMITPLVSQQ